MLLLMVVVLVVTIGDRHRIDQYSNWRVHRCIRHGT